MNKQTKVEVVAQVTQATETAKAIVLAGFSGLTVAAETQLRREVRAVNGKYQVVRNSLVRRSLNEAQLNALGDSLSGNNAIVYTDNDTVALMKAICDFAKTNKSISIKGGVLGGLALSENDVKAMADLPSREVLLSKLANVLQSPISGLATVLNACTKNLAVVIKAVADQKA
jgi:large subunit ribosomal protein L10